MSLPCLVTCIFELSIIGFLFLLNYRNQPTLPHLFIVCLGTILTTSSGKRWFVTFVDDHTCLTWVFLVSDKSEVTSFFRNFYHIIETRFNARLLFYRVTMLVSSKTTPSMSFCPPKEISTKIPMPTPPNKMA